MPKPVRPALSIDHPSLAIDRALQARPSPADIDWNRWVKLIDRKRRLLPTPAGVGAARMMRQATLSSFRLDGIEATDADLEEAVTATRSRRLFRSRHRQRIRNHLAILMAIERTLRHRQPLKTGHVLRWYTLLSGGLSTVALALPGMERMESVVRRINSPQMRLQPAVQEIARLHCDLLADPMFPSFNGLLVRLLLRVHLGRCGLPPVAFDPVVDRPALGDANLLLPRLLELLDQSLEQLRA